MYLEHLEVSNVRNFYSETLLPHPKINFIIGNNGSGKTSLLESISILSMGKSFRSADIKKVISKGKHTAVVFGKGLSNDLPYTLGVSKSYSGETHVKLNGELQRKMSSLIKIFPTIVMESNSMMLIEGGPAVRRSILDWGVMFHVEHDFLNDWHRFRKAYIQKTALLKKGGFTESSQLHYWERIFIECAHPINTWRKKYIIELEQYFIDICQKYFEISIHLRLRYKPGWNTEKWETLSDCLSINRESEIERRHCLYGPQRGDLEILWGGCSAKDFCSRGQKKLLLYGVRLAQAAMMMKTKSIHPILLLDDLPSELDKNNVGNVMRFLDDFPCQAFITATDQESIIPLMQHDLNNEFTMFHVEHGSVSKH